MKGAVTGLLASFLLVGAVPVFAALPCRSIIDAKDYVRKGGSLVHLNKEPSPELPPNFFCDRVACFGSIDFTFLIDEKGYVSNVSIVKNTWDYKPDWHAAVVTPSVRKMRYVPPHLGTKPACVLGKLRYMPREVAEK